MFAFNLDFLSSVSSVHMFDFKITSIILKDIGLMASVRFQINFKRIAFVYKLTFFLKINLSLLSYI